MVTLHLILRQLVTKNSIKITSKILQRVVDLDVYFPENLAGNEILNLLIVNDGQDLAQMRPIDVLASLRQDRKIDATIVVGVYAGEERLAEYGVANKPDFKQRGAKANLYTSFIVEELLPFLNHEIKQKINGLKVIAGFSLGGLTAFDIAWNHPQIFDKAGVFSGSFWWRTKDLADGYVDSDRIAHAMVRETLMVPDLKLWLMCGTEDEKADRNQNFIIDSIDDTVDLIKELAKKGLTRPKSVFYHEMVGGKHDVQSWAFAFPKFVEWAFSK